MTYYILILSASTHRFIPGHLPLFFRSPLAAGGKHGLGWPKQSNVVSPFGANEMTKFMIKAALLAAFGMDSKPTRFITY